ncbi:MAG: nitrate/nitrite transporter NrtS [Porticoccus sp.]
MNFFLQKHFFIIALVVGTLLNLINQGDVILSGDKLSYIKISLTYCVPYAVASMSSWLTLRSVRLRSERLSGTNSSKQRGWDAG